MSHKVFHPFVVLILALSLSFAPASTAFANKAQQTASNLIVNGDFEAGNTGFSSGYTLGPINVFEGVYGMLTDPASVHPAAASFGDHTSSLGLMMAVNGVGSSGIVVWSQSVPVTANTDYEFSAWVASWHPVLPAQLQFLINGSPSGVFSASSTTGLWQKFATTWNSGASTSATIEIINLNIELGGNDFALDDLAFGPLPCASLIVNGDFEAGNTGFSSGYTLGPINVFEGVYGMLTDPFSVHPAADSFGDHTSGLGLMMAVNGVGTPGIVVWSQSVPVTANTDYEFSAWVASWHPVLPAQLQFLINGSPSGTFSASSTTGFWQQFATTWNSGASTSATIEIINLNIVLGGNDFALDDLAFRSFTCDTPTATPTPTNAPTDNTPTSTPTLIGAPTNTPTATPVSDLGQLKVCKVAGSGIPQGKVFTIRAGNVNYSVPAGYCVLAGQFLLKTRVTVQEIIPAGYYVSMIEVRPDSRTISNDRSMGKLELEIGSGVTEVIFTNQIAGAPTATPASTSTPRPTRTPTSTPSCAPNCTPTPTPIPMGRMQICKQADGAGVSGYFTFQFNAKSRSIPVGACSLIVSVNAGTLTVTEDARAGYVVSDVYTIPADRLISEDLNSRSVTVTIVPGTAASQTIVVFVNRAVTSQVITDVVSTAPRTDVRLSTNPLDVFMQLLRNM